LRHVLGRPSEQQRSSFCCKRLPPKEKKTKMCIYLCLLGNYCIKNIIDVYEEPIT
jgi:hypothetical protein